MILGIVLINVIIAFVWGYFNFPNTLASEVMSILTKGKITHCELRKPLGCKVCMCFWTTLAYLLVVLPFTFQNLLIATVIALASAFIVEYTVQLIVIVDRLLSKLFALLYK